MYYTPLSSNLANHSGVVNPSTWSSNNLGGTFPQQWPQQPPPIVAPDPCTSQTATSWELFYNLGNTGASRPSNTSGHLLKRKAPSEDEEYRLCKQYITEEKMAARLNQLHIGDHCDEMLPPLPPDDNFEDIDEQNSISSRGSTSEDEEEGEVEGVIISSELKAAMKRQEEKSKVLPDSILKELEKPSLALVLWQPPGSSIVDKVQAMLNSSSTPSSSTEPNNNSNEVPDRHMEATTNELPIPPLSSNSSCFRVDDGLSFSVDEEMEDL